MHGVTPPLGQDFAFPFELHEISVCMFRQPTESPSLPPPPQGWQYTHLVCQQVPEFCVVFRLAESVLCPINQVINEGIKQYWPHINYCVTGDFFFNRKWTLNVCCLSLNAVIVCLISDWSMCFRISYLIKRLEIQNDRQAWSNLLRWHNSHQLRRPSGKDADWSPLRIWKRKRNCYSSKEHTEGRFKKIKNNKVKPSDSAFKVVNSFCSWKTSCCVKVTHTDFLKGTFCPCTVLILLSWQL